MPATFLNDFSDRISPMLVKELRQGMRAKTFIVVFLSLQVFLAVMLFSAGASATGDQVGSVVSGIIFTFFAIAVLVVQPLRGTGALASEVKGNTIDMMVLTRLSAWRIVFGKWVAIVSQSALLLATIIPYLILRYFFGGMNLFGEMVFLILMFLTSMALTAVTVGLSGCSSVIVRSLLPVIGLPILLYSLLMVSFSRSMGGGSSPMDFLTLDSPESRVGVLCYVVTLIYLGGSMLSLGASLIAPAAENHVIARRITALVLMSALFITNVLVDIDEALLLVLASMIAIPAITIALTDSAPLVSTVCKPFVKRGVLGRATGWFLYPTWSSGILFAIVIGVFGLLTSTSSFLARPPGYHWDADEGVVIMAFFGGLFFPSVWQAFLFRGDSQRIGHYLLLLVGSLVMLGILAMLSEAMDGGAFLWFFAWNPLAFIAMLNESNASDEVLFFAALIVNLILLLILLIRAFTDIRKSAPVIRETEAALEAAK